MPNNPKAAENLIPWREGESGNPNGRPKGSRNRATIARKVLAARAVLTDKQFKTLKSIYPDIEKSMTVEELMTYITAHKAITKMSENAYEKIVKSAYGDRIDMTVTEGTFDDSTKEELDDEFHLE